MLTVHTVSIFI